MIINPLLQTIHFNNALDLEISYGLYIIKPNLILENLLGIFEDQSVPKVTPQVATQAETLYKQLISLDFDKYNCAVIEKLSSLREKNVMHSGGKRTDDELLRIQHLSTPNVTSSQEEKLLEKTHPNIKINNSSNRRKFLINHREIGNMPGYIIPNESYDQKLKDPRFAEFFSNSGKTDGELKLAKEKCSKFSQKKEPLKVLNVSNVSNVSKESNGIVVKYKSKSANFNNYFPRMFYELELSEKISNTEFDSSGTPLIKFLSFGYWKFLMDSTGKQNISLDDIAASDSGYQTYLINMDITLIMSDMQQQIQIQRDFLCQNGFLIIIHPKSGKQPGQPQLQSNIRKIKIKVHKEDKEDKEYTFFCSPIKLKKKMSTYMKVEIDGRVFVDKIIILVFDEVE
jgi:hypothetical protein